MRTLTRLHRALGRLDEARRMFARERELLDGLRDDHGVTLDRVATLEHEIETLRSVVASAKAEDEAHALTTEALHNAKQECAELRRRCDALAERANDAERHVELAMRDGAEAVNGWTRTGKELEEAKRAAVELQAEVDRARQERDASKEELRRAGVIIGGLRLRLSSTPEPVASEPCAWCLGPMPYPYRNDRNGPEICGRCMDDDSFGWAKVRARVALRLRCCPCRLTSADPLAVVCAGCGAEVGSECDPGAKADGV